jgi:hypothetical protein
MLGSALRLYPPKLAYSGRPPRPQIFLTRLLPSDRPTLCDCGFGAALRTAGLVLLPFSPAAAAPRPPLDESRSIHVPRLDVAPALEDFVEMEPSPRLRGKMARVDRFTQWIPRDGQPASQRTEAYLGYDSRHLYVVFICFDSEPERLRARRSRREDILRDDRVDVFLDTFNDQRRSYAFTVNPYGIQADATWIEREAQEYDTSFDTVWDSRGTPTDRGFVIWIAVPFESLRFPPMKEQQWGILLSRFIPRANEGSFWPHLTSRIEGRLNQAGSLLGISDVSPGRNLRIIPYGFFRSFRALDQREEDRPRYVEDAADLDAGVDLKAVFRDSFVLDVTANPDFNQVESDEPQVTVNERFELYYPEKRPFFLENASYFETPINLFFSRRIVDPRLGLRLTGKAGGLAIGVLFADDEALGRSVPADDSLSGETSRDAVVRLSQDIRRQSSVGGIYTDWRLAGAFNRVGGLDGRLRLGENWVAAGQGVASSTRLADGTGLSGPAWDATLQRTGRQLSYTAEYNSRSPGFRTALGYLTGSRGAQRPGQPRVRRVLLRPDVRSFRQVLSYRFRPEGQRLIAWGPDLTFNPSWSHDGRALDTLYSVDLAAELVRQTYIGAFYTGLEERLDPDDYPALPASTTFSSGRKGLYWSSNPSRLLGFSGEYAWGSVINLVSSEGEAPALARSMRATLQVTWYATRSLKVEGAYLLSRVEPLAEPGRVFDNHIGRLKLNWQHTRRLSTRAIVQYDSLAADPARTSLETSRNLNVDLLVTYLVNPWTAVYAGYNDNRSSFALTPADGGPILAPQPGLPGESWQLFLKCSYLLRP